MKYRLVYSEVMLESDWLIHSSCRIMYFTASDTDDNQINILKTIKSIVKILAYSTPLQKESLL